MYMSCHRITGAIFTVALTLLLCSLGGSNSVWGQTDSKAPLLSTVIDGARKEGRLSVMWGPNTLGGTKGLAALEKLVNKKYGLNVEFALTVGPSMSTMGARLLQESLAGRNASSDIYVGFDVHFPELHRQDFFLPVDWKALFPHMVATGLELSGRVVRVYDGVIAFAYNTQLVAPADVPNRFEDLFKPKWKGQLAATTHATGLDRWTYVVGEKRGIPAVETFCRDYVKGLIRSTEFARVVSGEFPILVFASSVGDAERLREEGAPIDYRPVADAPFMSGVYVAVPKNSAHPNLAKLFISILHTQEAQDILWNVVRTGYHRIEGTQYSRWFRDKFAGVDFTQFTVDVLLKEGRRISELGKKYRKGCRG